MIGAKDRHYLRIAQEVARASKCRRAQYGAVLVSADDRIVATGRNGKPRGAVCDHLCFREGVPESERTHECCLHAERNALLFAAPQDRQGGTLYVTGIPCKTCALHLMQSGVRRLVYLVYSHSESGRRVSDDAFWVLYGVPMERVGVPVEALDDA
jgi:dCMP deaminase